MEPSGARFNAAETTLQRWEVLQQSRTLLHCCRSSTLLCSSLLCTALHCCQSSTLLCTVVRAGGGGELVSARERGSSSCSALANFAQPSAEQRGRRENRAALLVASCTKSGRAEWTGELDGRWWEVGDGRRAPQIPGLSPPQCTRPPICTPSDSSCLF